MPHGWNCTLLALLSILLVVSRSEAADRSWDGPAQQANVVEGGSGVWDLSLQNWVGASSLPPFPPINTTYRGNDRVIFGGAAGTVQVGANLTGANAAGNMHFTTGGYTFTLPPGNDLRVKSGITSAGASQPLFTLDAGTQTMAVAGNSDNAQQAFIIQSGTFQLEYTSGHPIGGGAEINLSNSTLSLLWNLTETQQGVYPSAGIARLNLSGLSTIHLGASTPWSGPGLTMGSTGTFNLAAGSTLRVTNDHNFTMRTKNIVLQGDASIQLIGSDWEVADDPMTTASLLNLSSHTLSITGSGHVYLGENISKLDRIQGEGALVIDGESGLSVEFAGQNTFRGGVRLRSGTLSVNGNSTGVADQPTGGPLGTGPIVITEGTLSLDGSQLHNSISLLGDVAFADHGLLRGTVFLGESGNRTILTPQFSYVDIVGPITGGAGVGLVKSGPGSLAIDGSSANSYSGETKVLEGKLYLGGGTLPNQTILSTLIVGDGTLPSATPEVYISGSVEQIVDTANVVLNGGRLHIGGRTETVGVLTMDGIGTIDFFGNGSSMAIFSAFDDPDHLTLQIDNWTGDLAGGGAEQLRFKAFDPSLLDAFQFTGYPAGGKALDFGSYFEIVPVPEPSSTVLATMGLLIGSGRLGRPKRGYT